MPIRELASTLAGDPVARSRSRLRRVDRTSAGAASLVSLRRDGRTARRTPRHRRGSHDRRGRRQSAAAAFRPCVSISHFSRWLSHCEPMSLDLTTVRGITEVCTACAIAASAARLTHGFKPFPCSQAAWKGPYGIRTRAAAVRGRCPRPLDEWAVARRQCTGAPERPSARVGQTVGVDDAARAGSASRASMRSSSRRRISSPVARRS